MEPLVTNVWSAVARDGRGAFASLVAMEATRPPAAVHLGREGDRRVRVRAAGLGLRTPAADCGVYDGVVRRIRWGEGPGGVQLEVELEQPAEVAWRVVEAVPVRLEVWVDRGGLRRLLSGLAVALDPAHGGADAGARGPVNLLEKDVTLKIAERAAFWLREFGARPALLRSSDETLDPEARRRRAAEAGARVWVALHTGHGSGGASAGIATAYYPGGEELARAIQQALVERLGRRDLGTVPASPDLGPDPGMPAAVAFVVGIADPVEEALLRSVVFRDRAGQAVARGLKNYWAARRPAWRGATPS
jgi:N-acetylmuramoyl-L-alanine amidase